MLYLSNCVALLDSKLGLSLQEPSAVTPLQEPSVVTSLQEPSVVTPELSVVLD